ncbi:MAG TPA: hypothetical protein VKG38_17220 [Solirubrobacteraceae bacterium]|nr:hypothetical protein [Solirubrobacteraceae bacterium]
MVVAHSAQVADAGYHKTGKNMLRLFRSEPHLAGKAICGPGGLGGMAIAGMLLVGLGVAGCGGSTSATNSTADATITKANFVAKANAICEKADPALSEAGAKLASLHSEAQIATVVDGTYVPSIEAQIAGIRALGTPPGGQAAVTSMLKLVQADLTKLKGDPPLVATDVFGDFARVAHPYGLTACAPLS